MDMGSEAKIAIMVDDREGNAVLDALRHTTCFDVQVGRLALGDYRVDERFLFERKTLRDLVGSIESGRLFSQGLRLAAVDKLRPALVLEGTLRDLQGCGMAREAIQGALVTVSLFIGLPVLRTRSPEETARTFLYTARQGRAVARDALARHSRRPKGKRGLQVYLLQGLPGVGPRRAGRLLQRFGTVSQVFAADEDALASVDGIGRETARRIRWAVGDSSAAYVVD
jgi:DNA excision repair protein ERCC-4